MGADDLVLCSGTLRRGIPFAERLDAASGAGFDAISLWGRDYDDARSEGLSDGDLRAMLDDHGLVVAELDPAWWWLPGASDVHIPPELDTEDVFRFGEAELFAVADALGARSMNAVDVFGGSWDVDGAAEAFAGLCTRAAEHDLLVHIEWLPWSKIPIWPPRCTSCSWPGSPTAASTSTHGTWCDRECRWKSWPRSRAR